MVSCAHLSVALRVALGASTWPGKRGFTIRRSSPTQRRNGRAFSSLTARGGGLPIGVTRRVILPVQQLLRDGGRDGVDGRRRGIDAQFVERAAEGEKAVTRTSLSDH